MREVNVELIRRFAPASAYLGSWEDLGAVSTGAPQFWPALEHEHRVLILADPGAGKTFEARERARRLRARGMNAFFIRIEAISGAFEHAFEIGSAEDFEAFCNSTDDAWFFLDSVDEAQLETPRALEEAIRLFGARIHGARERAHIFITSRGDAWQALSDPKLVDRYLPFGAPADDPDLGRAAGPDAGSDDSAFEAFEAAVDEKDSKRPRLKVFRLAGLRIEEIQLFAAHHGVSDVDAFTQAIERDNLMNLAERPFDLKALIQNWLADRTRGVRTFGGRLQVLQRMVELQLAPLSATGAAPRVTADRARAGVRTLAAAVILTGKAIIRMPDGIAAADRIEPTDLLPDWSPAELDVLLRTGIFDDIVYGSVRIRHREIRELLAAEWARDLLDRPGGRSKVETLLFRSVYGEEVIVPRMRPVLPWLILFDEGVRDRALALEPEIATEGGDPAQLPLEIRRTMLADIVGRIAAGKG